MSMTHAFKRLHYPISIISQCVRWYLAYSLSLRNLEEMIAEPLNEYLTEERDRKLFFK